MIGVRRHLPYLRTSQWDDCSACFRSRDRRLTKPTKALLFHKDETIDVMLVAVEYFRSRTYFCGHFWFQYAQKMTLWEWQFFICKNWIALIAIVDLTNTSTLWMLQRRVCIIDNQGLWKQDGNFDDQLCTNNRITRACKSTLYALQSPSVRATRLVRHGDCKRAVCRWYVSCFVCFVTSARSAPGEV